MLTGEPPHVGSTSQAIIARVLTETPRAIRSTRPHVPEHVERAVDAAGLREYYDPFTGRGMGASDFSWSALVMELVDPDPSARSSHVPIRVAS